MRRVSLLVLALVVSGACSDSSVASQPTVSLDDGPLHFTVTDAPAVPGFLFASANATGGVGMVTVTSTRYGSLCNTAITGHADVETHAITLRVRFVERDDAVCTADIRAITYRADVSGLASGDYDVRVVHATAPDSVGSTVYASRVAVK